MIQVNILRHTIVYDMNIMQKILFESLTLSLINYCIYCIISKLIAIADAFIHFIPEFWVVLEVVYCGR